MKTKGGSASTIIFILIGLVGFIYLSYKLSSSGVLPTFDEYVNQSSTKPLIIEAPLGSIKATVASTSEDRERGLGGRFFLPQDQGMLFLFPVEGEYGFWMKDTFIPLDIIWIRNDKTVAKILLNVTPDTYPEIFKPVEPVLYVLELNAGGAEKFGIATGTKLVF